jgi:hypothetical protein
MGLENWNGGCPPDSNHWMLGPSRRLRSRESSVSSRCRFIQEANRLSPIHEKDHALTLSMPPSWWFCLRQLCEERLEGIGIYGTSPEPWEVLDQVATAIQDHFGEEAEVL